MLADEGDLVKAGQVVARMDTQDLAASLKKSEAQVKPGAGGPIDEANANVAQQKTQVLLAQQELRPRHRLLKKGWADQGTVRPAPSSNWMAPSPRSNAATARVAGRTRARSGEHDVELYNVNIADNTLVAPRDGRIQYRIANIGEVLPAGGKVFTMLDISYVYMDIYLPTGSRVRSRSAPMPASCSTPIRTSRSRRRCPSSRARRSSRPKRWRPRASATS
jgi:HlyD family secretion protein